LQKDICTAHLLGPLPFFAPLSREVRDLLGLCLSFDPFARPSLEQLLVHPWLAKHPIPDWTQLSMECALAGAEVEAGEEETGAEQRQESGLASDDGGNCSEGVAVSSMAVKSIFPGQTIPFLNVKFSCSKSVANADSCCPGKQPQTTVAWHKTKCADCGLA
jgi:serine/threonine protein kinase